MRFSITTLATLLPFVASTLHQKSLEKNIIGDNIIADTSVLPRSQSFSWGKRELAPLVKELSEMDIYGGSFRRAVRMDKILLAGEDTPIGNEYNKRLAQRIITFVTAAEMYGLTIGGAVRKLIECLKSNIDNNLISLLMESNNMEIKAAILSFYGEEKDIWETYYSKIKEDGKLQKRILELIDLGYSRYDTNILVNWGASLSSEDRNIIIKPWKARIFDCRVISAFPLFVKYSLQHLKMSPKQVIIEFLNMEDLKIHMKTHAEAYLLSKTSEDLSLELAIALYNLSLPNLAEKILSKSNWNLLPEQEKLRLCSIYGEDRLLENHLSLKTMYDLDLSDAELVDKLLRSGNSREVWCLIHRFFDDTFSQEAVMKIGQIASLLVWKVSRNPAKYSWVSTKLDALFIIIDSVIDSCKLSFDTKKHNPVTATLDLVFDGGEIVDIFSRYGHCCFESLYSIVIKDKIRGRYRCDVECRFALKKLIDDEDDFNVVEYFLDLKILYYLMKFPVTLTRFPTSLSGKERWNTLPNEGPTKNKKTISLIEAIF